MAFGNSDLTNELEILIEKNKVQLRTHQLEYGGIYIGHGLDGSLFVGGADHTGLKKIFQSQTSTRYSPDIEDDLAILKMVLERAGFRVLSLEKFLACKQRQKSSQKAR